MNATCSTPLRQCDAPAQYRITPTCSHIEEDWPTMHACARHLAGVVYAASVRCSGHQGGNVVNVRPI